MRVPANLVLFAIAVLLTAHYYFFEAGSPGWAGRGRVFRDLDPQDILEIEISRPAALEDAAAAAGALPIKVRREGSPPEWWIVEPIRFQAYHPRLQAIAYDIADMVRVAEVPSGAREYSSRPEVRVRFAARDGERREIELFAEYPGAKLDLIYARVDGETFITRSALRKSVWVQLNELRSRSLLGVAPADAVRLEVKGAPRFAKVIERSGDSDRWRLKEPLEAAADREQVESLLRALNEWAVSSFVNDAAGPEDLKRYGLDAPRAEVSLVHSDGRTFHLEVGADAAPGASDPRVYVRHVGQPFVFEASSVSSEPLKSILEGHEVFRNRHVFDFGIEAIEAIETLTAEAGGPAITLRLVKEREKEKDSRKDRAKEDPSRMPAWEVLDASGAVLFPGDRLEIEGVLTALRTLLIQKFLDGKVLEPAGKLVLRTASGRSVHLLVGPQSGAEEDRGYNMYPVYLPGEPGSYLVSTLLPGKLREGSHAFRKKDVSDLDPARLTEIEVVSGGRTWMLARAPGEAWMLDTETPLREGKELSTSVVDEFLLSLHADRFRARRFLPEIGAAGGADFARHGLELQRPTRALVVHRVDGGESPAFHKLVLGDAVEGSSPLEHRARLDIQGMPPFTVEGDVVRLFDALLAHLEEATEG